MFKAPARAVVYAQLYTSLSFIGRLPDNWTGEEPNLILEDAFQLMNIPMPMQTPNGIAINIQTMMIPVNHLATGPERQAVDYDVCLSIIECDEKHPLILAYIQRTSRIQMVPPGAASQLLVPPGR